METKCVWVRVGWPEAGPATRFGFSFFSVSPFLLLMIIYFLVIYFPMWKRNCAIETNPESGSFLFPSHSLLCGSHG